MTPDQLIEKMSLPDSFHEIDENDLPGEWVRQPGAYLRTAIALAKAKKDSAAAKAALEECEADLATKIRQDPEKFRVTKLTEGTINEVIQLQQVHKEAVAKHIQAKYLVDLLEAATSALEHKKKALESLVYLAGQGMHAAPRVKSDESSSHLARNAHKANPATQIVPKKKKV